MTKFSRALGFAVVGAFWAAAVGAQTAAKPAQSAGAQASEPALRLSTTTADGDTGLWFVPTADVLARGKWSASVYRVGLNYREGFTNVGNVPVTFGVGLKRTELFTSFKVVTRVERDLRPLFSTDPTVGGIVARYPLANRGWSGNQLGDLLVGVKVNLMSEADQKPAAVALRGTIKLPTASSEDGAGTGAADGTFDFITSKDVGARAEMSGYGGVVFRGAPSGVTQSAGLRYGFGAGFPSRMPFRVTAEVNGEKPFDDTVTLTAPAQGLGTGTTSPSTGNCRGRASWSPAAIAAATP